MRKLFKQSNVFIMAILVVLCLYFGMTVEANSLGSGRRVVKSNNQIEEIIDDCENNQKNCETLSDEELEDFLETANENALIGKSEKEIQEYFSTMICGASNNTDGGIITSPVKYLQNTVAKSTDGYTVDTTKTISGVANKTCSDLGGHNNCTLTSLYNIMVYYRSKGYSKIPAQQSKLYNIIKKQASDLGYDYKNSKGLPVTKNNNLVTNTWRKGFGYSSGSGSDNYLWTASTAINLIDNSKPFMFSIASGVYYDHTVTVYGYKIYKNKRTGKKYTFLMIRDGWSNDVRYLAWTNTGASYVACLTSVKEP